MLSAYGHATDLAWLADAWAEVREDHPGEVSDE